MNRMRLPVQKAFEFFNILGSITEESRLRISSDGWMVRTVDPANVALISMDMPSEAFSSYEYTGEPIEVGIEVNVITRALEDANIEKSEDEAEFVFQAVDNEYRSTNEKRYKLLLKQGFITETFTLLLASELRKSPKDMIDIDTPCVLELYTKNLQSIVKKAHKSQDYLRFSARRIGDEYEFLAITDDNDTHTLNATLNYIRCWDSQLKERNIPSVSSLFSLDYLSDMVKAIVDEKVILSFGQDYPCSIKFNLCGAGKGEFLLSPRVEA